MILVNELTKGDLIIYEDENEKIEVEAFLYDETIWLPLNKIAELFEKNKMTISEHIKNIYKDGELLESDTNSSNSAVMSANVLTAFSRDSQ